MLDCIGKYLLILLLENYQNNELYFNSNFGQYSLRFIFFIFFRLFSSKMRFHLSIFRPYHFSTLKTQSPKSCVEYHRRQSIRNCNEAYLWKFDENRKLNKNNPLWRRPKAVNRNYSIFRITNCCCCCRCCCRCYCYWISIRFWFVVKSWFHRQRFLLFFFSLLVFKSNVYWQRQSCA